MRRSPQRNSSGTSPRTIPRTTTEEARDTNTETKNGPAHRPRNGGLTRGRTRTAKLTRRVSRARSATHGEPTRRVSRAPRGPSRQVGMINTGSEHRARRRSRTQCDSQGGGPRRGSSCGGKGNPTRRCTHLALPGPRLEERLQEVQWRPRRTPSGSSPRTPRRPHALVEPPSSRTTPRPAAIAKPPSCAQVVMLWCTTPRVTSRCRPPAEEGTCKATPQSLSCSGRKQFSTPQARKAAHGARRLAGGPQPVPHRRPRQGWHALQGAVHHLQGRGEGVGSGPQHPVWQAPGPPATQMEGYQHPPALLPLAHGILAIYPAGSGPHAGVVQPTHRLRTMEPWRTEAPPQACGTPCTGCRASRRASIRGRRCPPSWTDGLMIGHAATIGPWALPNPRDPRRHPPAKGAQPVALTKETSRSGCRSVPSRTQPCAGRNLPAWRGSGRTRPTPMEDLSGQQHRGPRAQSRDPSGLPPDGTRLSSSSSRTTAYCKSKGSWTSTGPEWSTP